MAMTTVRQKRKKFNLIKSVREIESHIEDLPDLDTVYKFVTDGGFSSISFVKYIADRCVINHLYASSFRIGKKEIETINRLSTGGRIKDCCFVVGALMTNDSESVRKYRYYETFSDLCVANGWEYHTNNNHSKILLFDTDRGKFVIETSSNLNENPKIEQFSFEQSEELFDFYVKVFESWR